MVIKNNIMKQQEILQEYYKLAIITDIQGLILARIKDKLKQLPKHLATQAFNYSNRLIKECDKSFSDENSEVFGIVADELKEWLDTKISIE